MTKNELIEQLLAIDGNPDVLTEQYPGIADIDCLTTSKNEDGAPIIIIISVN